MEKSQISSEKSADQEMTKASWPEMALLREHFLGGNTHLKTHSGEKSNKCNQCDYASSYVSVLKTHLKMHSGEKPNKCNQCDYASSQASHLRTHLRKNKQI